MGCPIGFPNFCLHTIDMVLRKLAVPLLALPNIKVQSAYLLINFCIIARARYLSRVSEHSGLHVLFANLHQLITECIGALAGCAMPAQPCDALRLL